ncbi:MAG: hypothetical protein AVDCRST_MAG78-1891, partial [uncultured Rubrobacteraceae bacterium]
GGFADGGFGPAHPGVGSRGGGLEPLPEAGPREGHRCRRGPLVRAARRRRVRDKLHLRAGEPSGGRAAAGGDGRVRRLDLGSPGEGRSPRASGGGRGDRSRGRSDPGGAAPVPGSAAHGPVPHTARGDGHRERHEHGEPHACQGPGRRGRAAAKSRGCPCSGGHQPAGRLARPQDRAQERHDPANRLHEDDGHHLPAGGDGRHDHRRSRPSGGRAAADSGPLHAPRQRLDRGYPGWSALVSLLLHPPPPAPARSVREL